MIEMAHIPFRPIFSSKEEYQWWCDRELRYAIKKYGPESSAAKDAAKALCVAHEVNPDTIVHTYYPETEFHWGRERTPEIAPPRVLVTRWESVLAQVAEIKT